MISTDTEAERIRPKRRWLWWVLGGLGGLLVLTAIASAFLRVPYYLIEPGSARPTSELIHVSGAPTYDSTGRISYMTVTVERATALGALLGWLDPSVDVWTEKQYLGDQTPKQNEQRNLAEMADSKQTAIAVALEALGHDVIKETGAEIVVVDPSGPSHSVLEPGDTITAVDGKSITTFSQLVERIGQHHPGDKVQLSLDRKPGGTKEVTVTLGPRPDQANTPFLGVSGQTRATISHLPVQVKIDTGDVGGPSAGLAFTLSVLNSLTPQDLTGGKSVATTGTMDLSGDVGLVGGVHQKTVAARRAGIQLFIVPAGEYAEAKKYAGNMDVEKADTLEQALDVLHKRTGADTGKLARQAEAALR